ncbi:MAG: ATP-binding protein [Gemmatimonadota bacterium]|jgi:signal transduction histidine kinase
MKSRDRRRPPTALGKADSFVTGLRAVLVALLVIAVLFAGYDVVEQLWLGNLTMEQIHDLHQVRGLVGALIAATVASWLILRAPPLFLDVEGRPRDRSPAAPASARERELRFAEWFIQMRWIAVVVAVVLVLMAIPVLGYLRTGLLGPLMALVVVLALMNLGYGLALRSRISTRTLLMAQAYGDLLVLTALLQFSGGIENPLGILMLFHVLIAGIVLSRRQCYLVAGGASILFAAMAWGQLFGVLPHYTLTIFPHTLESGGHLHAALDAQYVNSRVALQTVVLFLTGYFTSTVTAQLQRRERQLEDLADEALAQSQLLERSLDSTGTALCVCNANLQPTWLNPRWAEFFGADSGGDPGAATDLRARATLKDGSVQVGEVTLPAVPAAADPTPGAAADGRAILLTTAPLLDKQGQVTHVVKLARDVTELRRIQRRVGRAEQLAAVGELAGKVAHEVNNPIAVISAKARLLLSRNRDELSQHTAAELAKVTDLADKVAHIARGLLSYARPSTGAAAPTDIRLPIGRALSMIEAAAETAGVEVVEHLPPALPAVHVNAVEMEQVFVNLFMNALDAMPDGGRLSVRAVVETGGQMTVVVEDTGVGIPHELQSQVFEPFLTTKPEGKGTGLGLAVCLGLVRSAGGVLDLDSEPGRGTRVFVRLPVYDSTVEESAHA